MKKRRKGNISLMQKSAWRYRVNGLIRKRKKNTIPSRASARTQRTLLRIEGTAVFLAEKQSKNRVHLVISRDKLAEQQRKIFSLEGTNMDLRAEIESLRIRCEELESLNETQSELDVELNEDEPQHRGNIVKVIRSDIMREGWWVIDILRSECTLIKGFFVPVFDWSKLRSLHFEMECHLRDRICFEILPSVVLKYEGSTPCYPCRAEYRMWQPKR